jgi:hypothetical protein
VGRNHVGEDLGGGFLPVFQLMGLFSGFFQFSYFKTYYSLGGKRVFVYLFNTVSAENELKSHFRKQIKFRCEIGKKKNYRAK